MTRASVVNQDAGSLAVRMREARTKQKISLDEMAGKIGRSKGYLSTVETGKAYPSLEVVQNYERQLGLESDTLVSLMVVRERHDERSIEFERSLEMATIPNVGIQIRDGFGKGTLREALSESKRRIDILDTWIDKSPQYVSDLSEEILLAQKNYPDLTIRIALLDPDSELATFRSSELSFTSDSKGLIQKNIDAISEWKIPGLQLLTYDKRPPLQIYMFDDIAWVGFYLHNLESREGPQILTPLRQQDGRKTILGRYVESEFEYIWRQALATEKAKDEAKKHA